MARWPSLLVALFYLLPQAGLALHHEEEAPAACVACPEGPSIECAGDHCDDSGHHHHDSAHHHPGTCRTCTAADYAAVESTSIALISTSSAFAAVDVVPSSCAALQPGRSIRAPPAA
jgi:hypothetical protein